MGRNVHKGTLATCLVSSVPFTRGQVYIGDTGNSLRKLLHMADQDYLNILQQGMSEWNSWRDRNRDVKPDLHQISLRQMNLAAANLRNADLSQANLSEANLWGAQLERANLMGADLSNANLCNANLFANMIRLPICRSVCTTLWSGLHSTNRTNLYSRRRRQYAHAI
jgi:uncharacterized protein YjbI with pentapeptide repeats